MDKRGKFARFVIAVMVVHTIVICTDFYQQRALVPVLIYVQGACVHACDRWPLARL